MRYAKQKISHFENTRTLLIPILCFSKGKGQPTITPKKKGVKLGQRSAMSHTDCLKINNLYGCLDKSMYHRRKYYTLCKFMGL
jgi:hypothetical protein